MAFISKTAIKNAVALGTLNPKIIDKFFYGVKLKSYDFDYKIQEELVDLSYVKKSFYEAFTKNKILMDGVESGKKARVITVSIDKDIVHYAKRKVYKSTKFYNKIISQEDLMSRRDIFKFSPLVFINHKLYTKFRVQAREDKTLLHFDFNDFIFKIDPEDTIEVIFIPESLVYTAKNLNTTTVPDAYTVKQTAFSANDMVFFNEGYARECNKFIAFAQLKDPNSVNNEQLIFFDNITYDPLNMLFKFSERLPHANIANYSITLIGMERLYKVLTFSADTSYFQLDTKMPVPKNNMMVLVRDNNGFYHLNTDEIVITEYYPNIYKVTNTKNLAFKVFIFYAENPVNDLMEYDCEIEYFLSKMNLLDRYSLGTVPSVLQEYKPIDWDYSLKDFNESNGIDVAFDSWIPFLYKMNTINNIYKSWCYFFQKFLRDTYGFIEGMELDISTIDLNKRYRTSTAPEIGDEPGYTIYYREFDTPQYLFTYRNPNGNEIDLSYAWFIDGKFVTPTYMVSVDGYEYVYFDVKYINPSSYMEIERFDGEVFAKDIFVPASGVTLTMDWLKGTILANALFITKADGTYIDRNDGYIITVNDPALGDLDMDIEKSIFQMDKNTVITITPRSSNYFNTNIILHCNNRSKVFDVSLDHLSLYDDLNINRDAIISHTRKNIRNRLRIYTHEGRLLPKDSYLAFEKDNVSEFPEIIAGVDFKEVGKPLRVEYLGYDDELIYTAESIPQKGLLDLTGKINKPFSLVYYDVFLNGYKLNSKQIDIISPFVINIHDVNTVTRLDIYEKVKAGELFYFNEEESQYIADKLLREDPDYLNEILSNIKEINVDHSLPDVEVDYLLCVIFTFIMMQFINADLDYSDKLSQYDQFFDIIDLSSKMTYTAGTDDDREYMNRDFASSIDNSPELLAELGENAEIIKRALLNADDNLLKRDPSIEGNFNFHSSYNELGELEQIKVANYIFYLNHDATILLEESGKPIVSQPT